MNLRRHCLMGFGVLVRKFNLTTQVVQKSEVRMALDTYFQVEVVQVKKRNVTVSETTKGEGLGGLAPTLNPAKFFLCNSVHKVF